MMTLTTLFIFLVGCVSTPTYEVDPDAPSFNDKHSPRTASMDIPTFVTCQWSCSNPTGASISYKLYFGEEGNVDLFVEDITNSQ